MLDSVAVPGPDGAPRGGLIGLAAGAWLKIELAWLPTEMRGRGLGGKLLIEAEKRAAAKGCIGSTVTTSSSKACRFYERYGYIIRLQLPDARPEYTQITLQKTFD